MGRNPEAASHRVSECRSRTVDAGDVAERIDGLANALDAR